MERKIQLLMNDIASREDIERLLIAFYDQVRKDNTIGSIFNDVANVNWEHHIPVITDFWETLLLDARSYRNNAMEVHYVLNRKVPLEEKHFERWLFLFGQAVDERFKGRIADLAKSKAKSIASLMQFKMKQENSRSGLPIGPAPPGSET